MRSATATIFFFWPFSNGPWSRNTFNRYHTHTTRFSVTQRFIDGRLGRTYLWPINLAPLCYVSEVFSLLETKQNTKKVKKTAIAVTITHPHTNNKEPIILFFFIPKWFGLFRSFLTNEREMYADGAAHARLLWHQGFYHLVSFFFFQGRKTINTAVAKRKNKQQQPEMKKR